MFLYKESYLKLNCEIRNSLQQRIFGIGWYKSLVITSRIGLAYPFSIDKLNLYNFFFLSFVLDGWTWLEDRIRRNINININIMIQNFSYRGIRHTKSLPCNGQRTRTNAKSIKRLKKFYG